MNSHYQSDIDLQEVDDLGERDREISLGAATILGIFFALALICAIFFGFGYTLGRRSALPATNTSEAVTASGISSSKPSPGSHATQPIPSSSANNQSPDADAPSLSSPNTATADTNEQSSPASTVKTVESGSQADSQAKPNLKSAPADRTAVPPVPAAMPGTSPSVVQVAAVSHQEDADVLLAALKRHGYSVAIRQEPQDKLLHVQIGPFATKKDAEAMRQRLLADGYNAIVK